MKIKEGSPKRNSKAQAKAQTQPAQPLLFSALGRPPRVAQQSIQPPTEAACHVPSREAPAASRHADPERIRPHVASVRVHQSATSCHACKARKPTIATQQQPARRRPTRPTALVPRACTSGGLSPTRGHLLPTEPTRARHVSTWKKMHHSEAATCPSLYQKKKPFSHFSRHDLYTLRLKFSL